MVTQHRLTPQIILAALYTLCMLTPQILAQLTITEVRKPDGTTVTSPTAIDGYKYNLEAGDSILVKCDTASISRPKLLAPHHPLAQNERFGDSNPSPTGEFLYSNIQYYDTGEIECYSQDNGTNRARIYIFVYDALQPLFVPMEVEENGKTALTIRKNEHLPCFPTHSDVTVTMSSDSGSDRLVRWDNTDNTKGPRISNFRTGQQAPPWTCQLNYDGRTSESKWTLTLSENPDDLPQPILMLPNNIRQFELGTSVNITCEVVGQVLDFQWTFPALSCDGTDPACEPGTGRITETDQVYTASKTSVISVLQLTNLQESDTGTYTCNYNTFGSREFMTPKSVDITISAPYVTATAEHSDVAAVKGSTAIFAAKLDALPEPVVTWQVNGQALQRVPGKHTTVFGQVGVVGGTEFEARLEISDLALSDAGTYTMVAAVGDSKMSVTTFKLEVRVEPTGRMTYTYDDGPVQTITESGTYIYYRENKQLDLVCQALTGTPAPDITWSWQPCDGTCLEDPTGWRAFDPSVREPQPDVINSPYFYDDSPRKLKLRLKTQASGHLMCQVNNTVGEEKNKFLMVVSELPPKLKGIGFAEGTDTQASKLVVDDKITLICYVSLFHCSADNVQIHRNNNNRVWNKQSEGIEWNLGQNSYKLSVELDNLTLAMNGAIFMCSCRGSVQAPSVTLSVKSYIKPSWDKVPLSSTNITTQESTSFICRPLGRPMPIVRWYKDGEEVIPTAFITVSEDTYNLTLLRPTEKENGVYKCEGVTNRETITSEFTVSVKSSQLTTVQIVIIVISILLLMILAIIITVLLVRKYCRKRMAQPHMLLLPSKELINPDIPIDEQTDALPYDIGWEFPFANLKMGMLLGQGAFGRVLKAEAMKIEEGVASTTVAVKAVRDNADIEQIKALISELKILIHIGQHLNIVNLMGACTKEIGKGQILVIVEYCRYGNLRSYLLKHKINFNPSMDYISAGNSTGVKLGQVTVDMPEGDEDYLNPGGSEMHSVDKPLTLRDIISWCYQIARGMEYLASIDYIHRDLAARNVLLADDNIVKICDFGLAKDVYKYQEYQKQTDGPLPIKWMALESLEYKVFNVRTDIWAYGVTVWELFSLAATPYPGWDIDDTFIDKLKEGYRMEIPKHCPDKIYQEMMLNCWHPDPEKRPNFAECADYFAESLDDELRERLQNMEDPYLRQRDSRTDVKIRQSTVRRRDPHDLESDYLPAATVRPQANGSTKSTKASVDYYNTTPSGSQPNKGKKPWLKEKGSADEKMPLHVSVDSPDSDDMDMPDMPAPAPSPWERQSHLGKLSSAHSPNHQSDTHSHHSVDSDSARPPSYNYVMDKTKKPANGANRAGSTELLRVDVDASGSDQPYFETSC